MFACSYEFEELEIEVHGVLCGFFKGTADLREDGGTFYVYGITIAGDKVTRIPGRILPKREEASVKLDREEDAWLFNAIAAALYSNSDVEEFWFTELAEAA
jgi:hypothetical protein